MMPLLRLGWFRALLVAELLTLLAAAAGLWLLREQTLEGESRTLATLASAMALEADRNIGAAAIVLGVTQEELSRGLLAPQGPATEALLRERARAAPGFAALSLFDETGRRTATSRLPDAPAAREVDGRDFFAAARRAGRPELFLSEPYAPLADEEPAVSLSTGWYDAAGVLRGVVALVGDPQFLARDFDRIASNAVKLAVYRADGTPLLHRPGTAPVMPAEVVRALALRGDADPDARALPLDGRRLLVTAAPLTQLPLVQVVWRDEDAVLAGWTDLLWGAAAFVGATLALTLGLSARVARTQRRAEALEQRLARSRKLEALGNLAGGVAHDFNNVLAAVVGFAEMARQDAEDGSRPARLLDRVLQAAERGRQQVERILAFGRGQPRRSEVFRLQPVVAEVLEHLAASPRAGVTVEPVLAAPEVAVRGDATATYEAVMNLCTNALQAMPEGGTLRLGLDVHTQAEPRQLYDGTLAPGRYARLVVQDSGLGMTPEVMARLFEPFFTTRAGGGGHGIGLAVVHSVVADLGGGIEVHSQRGSGATFTLWLPAVDAPPEATAEARSDEPTGRGEAVLVVDDDPALVELAQEMLAGLGYEPLGTTSPAAALDALRRDPGRFDLLLTDEVMPGMSGTALAEAARALRPGLPVVLASGWGGEQFEARAAAAGAAVVLGKPLTRAALARALRRALPA